MRVAAGVLLIIAAVINLFAGLAYLGGGAIAGSMDKFAAMAEEAQKKQGKEMTPEQKQQLDQYHEAREKMTPEERAKMDSIARGIMGYGLLLLITVGTSIAGAVCLFRRKSVKFIYVASVVSLVVEVGSCVVMAAVVGAGVGAGKVVLSAFGITGGILGILGARQISTANTVPADLPPPSPPMTQQT